MPFATNGFSLEGTMGKVHAAVQARGGSGVRSLARVFKIIDTNGNRSLDRQELKDAMGMWELVLNEAEISFLMGEFDADGNGTISFDEFLRGLKGEMSERRKAMVARAYAILDADGSGEVTLGDIMAEYDASRHPQVMAGKITEEVVFKDFLDSFEGPHGNKDGLLTLEEFEDYYAGISASVDDDEYFCFMMEQAWKMSERGGGAIAPARGKSLEAALRLKVDEKKRDSENSVKSLTAAFKYFNLSGTNEIDERCFGRAVERFGIVLSAGEMNSWFLSYAGEGNERLNYDDFCARVFPDEQVTVRPAGANTTPEPKKTQSYDRTLGSPAKWRSTTAPGTGRPADEGIF